MKQVNFAVHIATLNPGGINGGMSSEGFTNWIKQLHPFEDGWRIDSVNFIQNTADGTSIVALVTQWKDDSVSIKSAKTVSLSAETK